MKDQIGEQGAARLAQIMGEIESPKKKTKIPGAKNIDGQKWNEQSGAQPRQSNHGW